MKYIIDLIEDIREEIGNREDFILTAMLLKENPEETDKLSYAGEAAISLFELDTVRKQLLFKIDSTLCSKVEIGELVKPLLIQTVGTMMYELRIDVNVEYIDIEVVGFGKSIEEKKYILFIKI